LIFRRTLKEDKNMHTARKG